MVSELYSDTKGPWKGLNMKRIVVCLLVLIVCVGLVSVTALADTGGYDVWIGGEQFASDKLLIQCDGGGTAALDVTTSPYTLTLDHAVIGGHTDDNLKAAIYAECGLNIVLVGENKLGGSLDTTELERGIHVETPGGDLSIIGAAEQTDRLEIYVKDSSNYKQCVALSNLSGNVRIENAAVFVSENGAENEMTTGGILGNEILVNNSSLTVQGFTTGSIHALSDVIIENSTVLLQTGMEGQGMGIRGYGNLTMTNSDVTINSFAYAIYLNHNADLTLSVSGGSLSAAAVDEGWIGIVARNIEMDACDLSVSSSARTFYVEPVFSNMELVASAYADGADLENYDSAKYKDYQFVATGRIAAELPVPIYAGTLPFTDVAFSDAVAEAVQYVYDQGLMVGVTPDRFAPESTLTRAMIWTILARMTGVDTESDANQPWYAKARTWAMEQGVTDGTYPERAVTRLELATMLWRFYSSPGAAVDVSGAERVPAWGLEALRWAAQYGLIDVTAWNQPATRGEAAVALYKA